MTSIVLFFYHFVVQMFVQTTFKLFCTCPTVSSKRECGSVCECVPLAVLVASCCLLSSDVDEAVHEDEPHFLLTGLGTLQLSRYLRGQEVMS